MSFKSFQCGFRAGHNIISFFVPMVCIFLRIQRKTLHPTFYPRRMAWSVAGLAIVRNFHHAFGAIDGKHVAVKKPHNSGSEFFDYKRFCFIVLLRVVDADFKFIWTSGSVGSASDAGIFSECTLRTALEDNSIGFPPTEPLPQDDRQIFILGNDAFPLRTWLMNPTPW